MNTPARHSFAIVALMVAGAAGAQTAAPAQATSQIDTAKIDFVTVDKDRNGSLSKSEAASIADLESAFESLDADHDQAVSRTEFQRWSRAGKPVSAPPDPATAPGGSAGAQHVPDQLD